MESEDNKKNLDLNIKNNIDIESQITKRDMTKRHRKQAIEREGKYENQLYTQSDPVSEKLQKPSEQGRNDSAEQNEI